MIYLQKTCLYLQKITLGGSQQERKLPTTNKNLNFYQFIPDSILLATSPIPYNINAIREL